jgi:acyl carrier protein
MERKSGVWEDSSCAGSGQETVGLTVSFGTGQARTKNTIDIMSAFLTFGQIRAMKDQIIEILTECLRERRVDNEFVKITATTDIEKDLGVDSLEGIELTCELSKRLRIEIPLEENILVNKDGNGCRRMRNVGEITARLLELTTMALPK